MCLILSFDLVHDGVLRVAICKGISVALLVMLLSKKEDDDKTSASGEGF